MPKAKAQGIANCQKGNFPLSIIPEEAAFE
jgi:hypothetical protein